MKARLANESVESELDELRQALMQTQDMASQGSKSLGDVQRNTEKIISKIKTKYEKKLAAAKKETEDAREVRMCYLLVGRSSDWCVCMHMYRSSFQSSSCCSSRLWSSGETPCF